jgi:uncharacterized protein YdeI (YjbR/CyaY-like superfamily)
VAKVAKKDVTFFAKPEEFRAWLKKNHATETEVFVGYYRKSTGKPSMTWPESVDEALCYGWIDGVRRGIDEESYVIRFTPRRTKRSIWSKINIGRMEAMIAEGRVSPAGLEAFETRDPADSARYSFEQGTLAFSSAQMKKFKANRAGWKWFEASPASYRKAAMWWVLQAKQEVTQQRRLETLIEDSEAGVRVKHLRRP